MRKNFEDTYRKLTPIVIKFIAKRTGADREVVEEICSSTMAAAWKGWHTFKHKSSYLTWICRIALNKIADYYRSEVHRKSKLIAPLLETLVEPDAPSLEEKLVLDDLKLAVARCLNLLPEDTRKVLRLRYWQEATLTEIAQIMGISPKAAESKLYRARKAFSQVVASLGVNKYN